MCFYILLEQLSEGCGEISARPSTLFSTGGYDLIHVFFENRSGFDVNLFWIGYDGEEDFHDVIPDGDVTAYDSYLGHVFLTTLTDNTVLTINGECFWRIVENSTNIVVENLLQYS